eukprot:g3598.t1
MLLLLPNSPFCTTSSPKSPGVLSYPSPFQILWWVVAKRAKIGGAATNAQFFLRSSW